MFQIFLNYNKTYTMMVTNDTTITDIYQYILEKLKIPSKHYYLMCGNKILDEKFNLSDYSIKPETTIHVVIRSVPHSVKIN